MNQNNTQNKKPIEQIYKEICSSNNVTKAKENKKEHTNFEKRK